MKYGAVFAVVLILSALALPAVAAPPNQYSYITVSAVTINLEDEQAFVTMEYEIDSGIVFLVHLLGTSDLKKKLLVISGFEGAKFQKLDMSHAVLIVPSASQNYGEGTYWFPEHTFGIEVPEISIVSSQMDRTYNHTSLLPGMGYFGSIE